MVQSWFVVSRETGEVVIETWNQKAVDRLNTEKYAAIPALEYLSRINAAIRDNNGEADLSFIRETILKYLENSCCQQQKDAL